MTWARFDDGFWRNPKIVALPPLAFRLYVRAVVYSCDQRTDGQLDQTDLDMLQAKGKEIAVLAGEGLWLEGGLSKYEIKDFLKYNPSKADIEDANRKKAAAGAKGAASRYGKSADATATATARAIATPSHKPRPRPVPDPRPDPGPAPAAREPLPPADALTRMTVAFDGLMGRLASTVPIQQEMADWLNDSPGGYDAAGLFEDACREAAVNDGRSLRYVLKILDRWAKEGRGDRRPKPNGTSGDPERDEYLAAKQRGANSGAGLVVFTMSDQRIIDSYEAKQREAQSA